MDIYRERAYLVLFVANMHEGAAWLSENPDEKDREDGWRYILYVDTERGQLSWHIADSDLDLFVNVPKKNVEWDGHITEEKYERLRYLDLMDIRSQHDLMDRDTAYDLFLW